MSNFKLSQRSLDNLIGVKHDLVNVVKLAIQNTEVDFCVIEGLRDLSRQKILVRDGKSQTIKSRHLTGHAVDLAAWVNGAISYDWSYYEQIAVAMKAAARELKIAIQWGGDWHTLKDGMHFQLPW